jgi:hypothetical protein
MPAVYNVDARVLIQKDFDDRFVTTSCGQMKWRMDELSLSTKRQDSYEARQKMRKIVSRVNDGNS